MTWQLLAISAAALWAGVNIIDKHLLSGRVKNPLVMFSLSGVFTALIALGLRISGIVHPIGLPLALWAMFGGALGVFAASLYFHAVKMGDISRIAPLFHVIPLYTALFAAVFLNEVFTIKMYIGITVIVLGAIMLSPRAEGRRFKLSNVFWLVMLSSAIVAVSNVITKHVFNASDYWTVFFYIMIGQTASIIPIIWFARRDVKNTIIEHGRKVVWLLLLVEVMDLSAMFMFYAAMFIGYVTLVNTLAAVQPFFILLFAVIASIWFPKILKEEISRKTVAQKLVAIALIFAGVLLVS